MSYKEILHKYWGYPDFRGIQRELIESIGAGRDTLGLMPTGGGKSIAFQVPALAMEGVCIVITPLISLMKDQVDHLRKRSIRAAAIYSGMSREEVVTTLENCIFGGIKLLYVSPERLSSDLFQAKLKHIKVSFITVDEAHCISQWGYDFRPSYLEINVVRKLIPRVPVLALTATATPAVVDDIQERLCFEEKNVFRMSFERKNLTYVVRKTEDKYAEMEHILGSVEGSAIVYCRSRKRTREVAELLMKQNISATWYHAGLEPAVKDQRQNDWQGDKIRVMAATNAFGMGIDKPDVRMVIHVDCPSSLEAYFQEAGRAGRDGNRAYAVLLFTGNNDVHNLRKRISDTFPPKEYIQTVYEHLAYFYQVGVGSGEGVTFEFPMDKFCISFKHFPIQVNAALMILQRAGYLDYDVNPDTKARIHFLLGRDELYRLREQSHNENEVITSLLRNYSGLFSNYCYIDESYIAQDTGLDRNEVYQILQSLSRKRILDFIPRKNIPFITYLRDREDGENIHLSKDVYEDRKQRFEERVLAVANYAQNDHVCRSRQLLRYFGEKKSTDCLHCDVCLSHSSESNEDVRLRIRMAILELLSDRGKHLITELRKIPTKVMENEDDLLAEVLEGMVAEEELVVEGSFVSLPG